MHVLREADSFPFNFNSTCENTFKEFFLQRILFPQSITVTKKFFSAEKQIKEVMSEKSTLLVLD